MWTKYTHLNTYEFLAALERKGLDSDALEYIHQGFDRLNTAITDSEEGYQAEIENLEAELYEANNRLEDLESEAIDSDNLVKQLESEAIDSDNLVKQLESEAIDSDNLVKQLESEAIDSDNLVKQLEYENELLLSRIEQLTKEPK